MKLIYPKSEITFKLKTWNAIKQNDFVFISEYFNEIPHLIKILSNIKSLTQTDTERMIYDSFYMRLGEYTSLEICEKWRKSKMSKIS